MSETTTFRTFEQSQLAAAELKKQGIRVAARPQGDRIPTLPRDITSLGDEDLMDLFVAVTSWVDYLSVQVAFAQIDERAAERTLEYAEATAMVNGWTGGKDSRVAIAKAQRLIDPVVKQQHDELEDKHSYRKLIETVAANLDRDAALISRELTRRTSTPTPTRRGSRLF